MARILVVDDERDVVKLMRFMLEKDGHQVLDAYNGGEALAALGLEPPGQEQVPDLMLLDVMMPVADGYTVASRAAEADRTRGMPIVMLTAKGQTRELFEGLPNVAAVVEKPFDAMRLRELVAGILKA